MFAKNMKSQQSECIKEVTGEILIFRLYIRLSNLLREICSERESKCIIFVETKKKVDDITRAIRREGCVKCNLKFDEVH